MHWYAHRSMFWLPGLLRRSVPTAHKGEPAVKGPAEGEAALTVKEILRCCAACSAGCIGQEG